VLKRARPEMIGAFVLGAIALLLALVMILGSGRLFRKKYHFVLLFDSNVNGLRLGAPVKFRGVEIGRVTEILFNISQLEAVQPSLFSSITIPVLIEIDRDRITSPGARQIDLDDPKEIDRLIHEGLRAQLELESILTGMLYVNLTMRPSTPARLLLTKEPAYREIPTLPTQFELIQQQLVAIVAKLNETDLQGFVTSGERTSNSIREFMNSPQVRATLASMRSTLDSMRSMLTQLRGVVGRMEVKMNPLMSDADRLMTDTDLTTKKAQATLDSLQASIKPNSPVTYKLDRALDEVAAAAASMRNLTDYLERNPSAVIWGKPSVPTQLPTRKEQTGEQIYEIIFCTAARAKTVEAASKACCDEKRHTYNSRLYSPGLPFVRELIAALPVALVSL
jgi:paraquat-inducible protein B